MTDIIEALTTFIGTYPNLKEFAPLTVDELEPNPTNYSIVPMPGEKVTDAYIGGDSDREYPFALQSMESTLDEVERLANAGFFEGFSRWLEIQNNAGNLPSLDAELGQEAFEIEALSSGGVLYEQGESSTGVYQILCKLYYSQEPL